MDNLNRNILVTSILALTGIGHVWLWFEGVGNDLKLYLGLIIFIPSIINLTILIKRKLKVKTKTQVKI